MKLNGDLIMDEQKEQNNIRNTITPMTTHIQKITICSSKILSLTSVTPIGML